MLNCVCVCEMCVSAGCASCPHTHQQDGETGGLRGRAQIPASLIHRRLQAEPGLIINAARSGHGHSRARHR